MFKHLGYMRIFLIDLRIVEINAPKLSASYTIYLMIRSAAVETRMRLNEE